MATYIIELEITVGADVRWPRANEYDAPTFGPDIEDAHITHLVVSEGYIESGKAKFREVNLLDGVNTDSPDVQKLLSALLDFTSDQAEDALMQEHC